MRDWVIRKNGYFYRANRCGYTQEIGAAGDYTEAEAKAEAKVEPSITAHRRSEFQTPDDATVVHYSEWYANGIRMRPGVYSFRRVGDVPLDAAGDF